MSEHKQFTIDAGITVSFAHPGAPGEGGTNEHTHGLRRQDVPNGTEFDKGSTREIKRVQRELNNRPRAVLCGEEDKRIGLYRRRPCQQGGEECNG